MENRISVSGPGPTLSRTVVKITTLNKRSCFYFSDLAVSEKGLLEPPKLVISKLRELLTFATVVP